MEFCEEDIKDVFSQFKDRFHIRKLLRDICERKLQINQTKFITPPGSNSLFKELSLDKGDPPRGNTDTLSPNSRKHNVVGRPEIDSSVFFPVKCNSSDVTELPSVAETLSKVTEVGTADPSFALEKLSGIKTTKMMKVNSYVDRSSPVFEHSFDLVEVKQEHDQWSCSQQQQHTHTSKLSNNPLTYSQSGGLVSSPLHASFQSSTFPHHSVFNTSSSFMTASKAHSHTPGVGENPSFKRSRYEIETGCEEQALCLKKEHVAEDSFSLYGSKTSMHQVGSSSPSCPFPSGRSLQCASHSEVTPQDVSVSPRAKLQSSSHVSAPQQLSVSSVNQRRVTSPLGLRSNNSSPASQPSSTTPDLDSNFILDSRSLATISAMAARYTATEILSKKSQRSSPNSAQKLGSIIIRSAAQQAGLWDSTPLLRSITEPQRQCFISAVYQVAPHIHPHQNFLWQRLSETLQNRRKYLLDKRLGKRGFCPSTSGQPSSTCGADKPSMSNHSAQFKHELLASASDLSDIIRDWQTSAMLHGRHLHGNSTKQQENSLMSCVKTETCDDRNDKHVQRTDF